MDVFWKIFYFLVLSSLVSGRELSRARRKPPPKPQFSCDFQGPFPYAASIRDELGMFRCGAVVIQSNAVITSASCIDPSLHNGLSISEVFLGGANRENPIEKRPIASIILHQDYNGNPRDGADLAIVKFQKETCVKPIPNLGKATAPGEYYLLLGFGRTASDEPFAGELHVGNITNFELSHCNATNKTPLDPRHLCTQGVRCQCGSTCEGDEGGPIVYFGTQAVFEDILVGVQSFATGVCEEVGTFGVHTAIQPYLNWIMRALQSPLF